jgi:hypothetical protein
MLRVILAISLGIAILGIAYCLMGLIQLASYSAGPNYPKELAVKHFWYWISALGFSFTLGICFLVLFLRLKKIN